PPDGDDLVRRRGFIIADDFVVLLDKTADNPVPERGSSRNDFKFAESPLLDDDVRQELVRRHYASFDFEIGGLKTRKKSMDRPSTEYSMLLAANGDDKAARMARLTIDNSLALIDPEWGGAYQYSTHGDWQHPHYEKIMTTQAGYLRIYALAYLQWGDERYLEGAKAIERYLADFLTSPDGGYYTSQDADLIQGRKGHEFFALSAAERLAAGMPRIDTNVYSRENGWAIEAVTTLYRATGDVRYLERAVRAADWIVENRAFDGGYRHGESDTGGPYLSDTLNMGRAFLELYRATGERRWLILAGEAAAFIETHFKASGAGFLSGAGDVGPVRPQPYIDENISVTRFLNLLSHYTGNVTWRDAAEHGMRYLATEPVALRRFEETGVVLAAFELANDPAHFTVIAGKQETQGQDLYAVTRRQPGWYVRAEWWDPVEGPLPNPDVRYPVLDRAAAFVCTRGRCSVPAFDPARYDALIIGITAR
ncbi:MAG: hypothetical protein ACE5F8_07790, partial [Woeseiaceae bacterium]